LGSFVQVDLLSIGKSDWSIEVGAIPDPLGAIPVNVIL
jgi:hypothetical protein